MSLPLIDAHRDELADIGTLLSADLAAGWPLVAVGASEAVIRSELFELTMDLGDYYGSMAAGAGADWYEELRAESGARGRYVAAPVVALVREQIDGIVGYAAGPLLGAEPAPAAALSRLDGGLQRVVTNAERETVLGAVERDTARPRWYRYASANACSFCAMIASRGATYRSEDSGGFKSHDHCGCFPVPLWPGQQIETPHINQFMEDYFAGRKAARRSGEPLTTKSILKHMRATTGRK